MMLLVMLIVMLIAITFNLEKKKHVLCFAHEDELSAPVLKKQ